MNSFFERIIFALERRNFFKILPDEVYIGMMYKLILKKSINLQNPQTFNEKLQWLKLHDRKPIYTTMVDKYAVKKYIAKKIGKDYIIPTLGVWNSFDEIDFDSLPNQFVLKCTHDSGGLVICKDKSKFDKKSAKEKLENCLKKNYYWYGREYPYKNVKPRIIAEKYMEDSETVDLRDYKFYCFNGKPLYCQVISDRYLNESIDFFDMKWKHQEFTGIGLPHKPFSKSDIKKPHNFEKMKYFCNLLAKNISFVRVDFYEINKKLYFGEMTFYPSSGFGKFSPDKWNYYFGSMIKLPDKKEM